VPCILSGRTAAGFSILLEEYAMLTRSWIRRALTRPAPRPIRKAPLRARPGLELLEDRCVPSIVVNNPTDTPAAGLTDLREAIAQANAMGGDQMIVFDSTVFNTPQTITLSGTNLELSDMTGMVTITGPAAGVTVSGGGLSQVFQVDSGVTATFLGLTITGGLTASGGGLNNSGTTTLSDCTISGNSAARGGGLYNSGSLTLTDCTVSGNRATGFFGQGSGVFSTNYPNLSAALTLTNCTVSGNSGTSFFGRALAAFSAATLTNTIVAGNSVRAPDIFALSLSGSNNLIGIGFAPGLTNGVDGNLVGVTKPLLAPLGNYGGPTQTMALLPGSPALDAGTSGPGIPSTDQRGLGRVGAVDIGAFESQGFTLTPFPGSTPQTATIGTAFAQPLGVVVTANNPVEPVDGGVISFVANPAANGATAILASSSVVLAGGQAAITAGPNNVDGNYTVSTSLPGLTTPFNLTNVGRVFAPLAVNTTSDALFPGVGLLSLREAIAFNNTAPSGNAAINFAKSVFNKPQTITLTGTQLELSNPQGTELITGPASGVTLNGAGLSRVFQVDSGVTAILSKLTITGGNSPNFSNGGGMTNSGSLTLANCTVTGNFANSGGGAFNSGFLTLASCTVSGNSAVRNGGGVLNSGTLVVTHSNLSDNSSFAGCGLFNAATATLANCTVSGNTSTGTVGPGGGTNSGGGVFNGSENLGIASNATLSMSNCTISGNYAGFGGGVYNLEGTAALTNCTVSGNRAGLGGGGVFADTATTTLTNCTISGNSTLQAGPFAGGGGVYSGFGGTLMMTACTVSGNSDNSGSGGGGLINERGSTATLVNCTIRNNSSTGNGGGVNSYFSTLNSTNCTIRGNTAAVGGGLYNDGAAANIATLTNCTVTGNTATTGGGGGIANQATLNIVSGNIRNNVAASTGGGISTSAGSATITDCVISHNTIISAGTAQGGGIYSDNCVLTVTYSTINANQANGTTAQGGGIYALDSTLDVENCTVNGNKANGTILGEGGGMYLENSLLAILASNVKGNKATTAYDDIFSGP
jgi:hypothetical protein